MRAIRFALTVSGFAGIFMAVVLTGAVLTAAVATQLSASPMSSNVGRT